MNYLELFFEIFCFSIANYDHVVSQTKPADNTLHVVKLHKSFVKKNIRPLICSFGKYFDKFVSLFLQFLIATLI